ncbi:Ribosome assembly protein [Venturia nashicola]|uniref:Ribosome assembly protein n=1 Tax=Venturia nashicola TaxID=86259 RepID=A0A4Z1P937_9PEZI|nr:Ribosome assembly protein [Venturia nashicola]TLD29436.1 Ribosome assembly protein [Venturia nashicola]
MPNTTVYKLGWGTLNEDGQVNKIIKFSNLQLDIVGFLAILGEGSVLASSSVATLSKVIFLPRLLPAPQALLRPSRPDKLPSSKGWAIGVHSGNDRDYVNFVGHTLADADRLPEYSVKCIEIKRRARYSIEKAQKDLQKNGPSTVKAKILGPTTFVALLGFSISLVLFAFSIQQQDGMGMLADICLSFLSTLIGLGNKWTLGLVARKATGKFTPKGDVVIRYPKGNFVVVRCTEEVARELFFAPENIEYLVEHPWKYRMIALVGTIILMFGVIFLGNAGTNVQVAYAVSFMVLNAGYWIVAALPQRYHWDTRCFEVIHQAFDEPPQVAKTFPVVAKNGNDIMEEKDSRNTAKPRVNKSLPELNKRKACVSYNETFTQALWRVIVATQDVEWIKRSKTAPATEAWDDWLYEAVAQAESMPEEPRLTEQAEGPAIALYQMPQWDAQAALTRCMKSHADDSEKNKRKFQRSSTPATLSEMAFTAAGAEMAFTTAGAEIGKNEASSSSVQVV